MWWTALVSLALVAVVTGCAAGLPKPPLPPSRQPVPEASAGRDDAAMIVQDVVRARVALTLHLDHLEHRRLAPALARLTGLEAALAGTGVDLVRDVRRAFLAARTAGLEQAVIVVQHAADEAVVSRSLAAMRRSFDAAGSRRPPAAADPGARGPERIERVLAAFPDPSSYPFPAAYRVVDRAFAGVPGPVLIAAPRPGLLVVLPPEQVIAAFRMTSAPGLPPPAPGEVLVLRAWDPRSSVPWGFVWWGDIRYAEVAVVLGPGGGGELRLRARCGSDEGARLSVRGMEARLEQARALPFGLRIFDLLELRAAGARMTMRGRLLEHDIDWLAAMVVGL